MAAIAGEPLAGAGEPVTVAPPFDDSPDDSPSFAVVSGGFTALGFVMVIADFCTVREAIALALAR